MPAWPELTAPRPFRRPAPQPRRSRRTVRSRRPARPRLVVLLLALLLGTVTVACGPAARTRAGQATGPAATTQDATARATDPDAGRGVVARVALLLPLTGQHARIGEAMLNAAELALYDVAVDDFVLLPRDTGGTPEGARAAAEDALANGTTLILGPLLAGSVEAVHPLAAEAGVNVISFSSDETVAGNGAFVTGFLPRAQIARAVAWAAGQGVFRYGVLAPDTAYGRLVAEESRQAVAENAGSVTRMSFYDPVSPDVSATVRDFASFDSRSESQRARGEGLDYEAVILPEGGLRLLQVAPLLPFFDVDADKVLFIGTGQWDSPIVHEEPNLIGGVFAAAPPEARLNFVRDYAAAYGQEPPRLATLAYDATALAAILSRAPGGADFSQTAITNPSGFAGIDGIMRFLPDGTVERSLAVLRIARDDSFTVASPASSTFVTVATE